MSGPGWLAKIGHLYPSGGQCDYEVQRMAPNGVQFFTTRLPFTRTGIEDDRALVHDLELHAKLVADAEVDLIALNCTAASAIAGPDLISARILAATGVGGTSTFEAVLAGLRAAGLRKIALVTAYSEEVTAEETSILREHGIDVVAIGGIACTTPVQQGLVAPERWRTVAQALDAPSADGLLISCAGIQLSPVLAAIEQDFGRPAIASNQALVWHCLRRLRIEQRSSGFGSLLEGQYDS